MTGNDKSVMRHYFDWAATAVPDYHEEGKIALPCPTPTPFGNPSSRHTEGRAAKDALEAARSRCAKVLGVPFESLYFTSGGTEANCIALYSNLFRPGQGRILCSRAEHPSIVENVETLGRLGKPTGVIPVDSCGRVTAELLASTLAKYGDVRFAAIMAVNNEAGAINDIPSIKNVLKTYDGPPVHLHCDMVQAAGKIPLDLAACDSASISAHKLGGPRGIGLLYLRQPLEVLYAGGGQERKQRPGTENTAGALALADCLEKHAHRETVQAEYKLAASRMKRLATALASMERCIIIPAQRIKDIEYNGGNFSPYILQVAFRGIPGEVMVRALDDCGFAVSTGSACGSFSPERPVLEAMGIDSDTRLWGIRISQGWSTSDDEIELLIEAVKEILKTL